MSETPGAELDPTKTLPASQSNTPPQSPPPTPAPRSNATVPANAGRTLGESDVELIPHSPVSSLVSSSEDISSVSSEAPPTPTQVTHPASSSDRSTPELLIEETSLVTSTPATRGEYTPTYKYSLGTPIDPNLSSPRYRYSGIVPLTVASSSESDDLYPLDSHLEPRDPSLEEALQDIVNSFAPRALTPIQDTPVGTEHQGITPSTYGRFSLPDVFTPISTPASVQSIATELSVSDTSIPLPPPNTPVRHKRYLPPTLQRLIYQGQPVELVTAVASAASNPQLEALIKQSSLRWLDTIKPLNQAELSAYLPDSTLEYQDSEHPLVFERKIRRELDLFLKDPSIDRKALLDRISSGESYFEESEFQTQLGTSPPISLAHLPWAPPPRFPLAPPRRVLSPSPRVGTQAGHNSIGNRLVTPPTGRVIDTPPVGYNNPASTRRQALSNLSMASKRESSRDPHVPNPCPGTTTEVVQAINHSMADLLDKQQSNFEKLLVSMETRMEDRMGMMRQETHEVECRRVAGDQRVLEMEKEMMQRHTSALERYREQTDALGTRSSTDMRDLREDLYSEINRRCTYNDSGHAHHQFGNDHSAPSPIHAQQVYQQATPLAPTGGTTCVSDPISSTPHYTAPATQSSTSLHPTGGQTYRGGHDPTAPHLATPVGQMIHDLHGPPGGGYLAPPSYNNLHTQASRLEGSTPHRPGELHTTQSSARVTRGQVAGDIYLSTPNYPDPHDPRVSPYHLQAVSQMAPGAPTSLYQQRENRTMEDLNSSDLQTKYSSAQLNSFVKPQPFGKQTAYRSAEKFLMEYKFFIEAMYPGNHNMQAKCMYGHLEGRAQSWYYTNVMDKPLMFNRDALYAAFLDRFSGEDPESVVKGYRNRRQKPAESMEDYMTDMISLLSNSHLDEKTQVDYLINGFKEELANAIRVKLPKKITDVEKLAIEHDIVIQSIKKGIETAQTPDTAQVCELRPLPYNQGKQPPPHDPRRNSWSGGRESRYNPAPQSYSRDYEDRYRDAHQRYSRQDGYRSSRSPSGNPRYEKDRRDNRSRDNSPRYRDRPRSSSGHRSQSGGRDGQRDYRPRSSSGNRDRTPSRNRDYPRYNDSKPSHYSNSNSNNSSSYKKQDSFKSRGRDPTPGRRQERSRPRDKEDRRDDSSQDRNSRSNSRSRERPKSPHRQE